MMPMSDGAIVSGLITFWLVVFGCIFIVYCLYWMLKEALKQERKQKELEKRSKQFRRPKD
jgi:threonine/homoserine/homoserine lactone efflux protein